MYLLLMLLSCHSPNDATSSTSVDIVYAGFELQKEKLKFDGTGVPTDIRLELTDEVSEKIKLQLSSEIEYATLPSRSIFHPHQN